jgi:hypothetical protein
VEQEIKKNARQPESPRRAVAAHVRFDFNDLILRPGPVRQAGACDDSGYIKAINLRALGRWIVPRFFREQNAGHAISFGNSEEAVSGFRGTKSIVFHLNNAGL